MHTYNQKTKNQIRHRVLMDAVNMLTVERGKSCCVSRMYVRTVVDYFLSLDEDEPSYKEVQEINQKYIISWEALHDSVIGEKRPSDLSVCYLSGTQPKNDFEELINLGVLPQNIWAFESDKKTYEEAINSYSNTAFPQPKIIKMSVEHFFKQSPKKFDIVYIDACGSIVSDQRALRSVSTLFQYQRLNSPGVLITNFARPDISKDEELEKYTNMISLYLLLKEQSDVCINDDFDIDGLDEFCSKVKDDFDFYYGKFISGIIADIPAILIPLQRLEAIAKNSNLFESMALPALKIEEINQLNHNSICKWILLLEYIKGDGSLNMGKIQRDLLGLDGEWEKLVFGARLFINLKSDYALIKDDVKLIKEYFENASNFYQFLDRPTSSLFYDMIINQLTYPLHNNVECSKSYKYCAKNTEMFTDVAIFDECRYLYEWLPTIHQIVNAIHDKSWQYIYRFALDGLVKQRLNYNNEFFFQGSVISKEELGFKAKCRQKRKEMGE